MTPPNTTAKYPASTTLNSGMIAALFSTATMQVKWKIKISNQLVCHPIATKYVELNSRVESRRSGAN
ncbi:hypothetical protein N9093_01005, partial [bacterium]|nr:hypothetical protein [bacterium]